MQEAEYASIEPDGAERAGRNVQEEHVGQKEVFRRHDFRYAATILTLLLCCCLCVILVASQRRSASGARSALVGDDLRLPDGFQSGTRQSRSTHDDPLVDSIFNGARPAPPKRSFSIPPAGIFTGHTHKPRGTPLTFGENTYFVRNSPLCNMNDMLVKLLARFIEADLNLHAHICRTSTTRTPKLSSVPLGRRVLRVNQNSVESVKKISFVLAGRRPSTVQPTPLPHLPLTAGAIAHVSLASTGK